MSSSTQARWYSRDTCPANEMVSAQRLWFERGIFLHLVSRRDPSRGSRLFPTGGRRGPGTNRCTRVRRIGYDGSGSLRLFDKRIDLSFATHKVSQRTFGRAARAQRHFRLMGHVLAGPDRQLLAVHQIKKYDGPMWVLGADNASRGQPESIPIECQCTFKIVDTEC